MSREPYNLIIYDIDGDELAKSEHSTIHGAIRRAHHHPFSHGFLLTSKSYAHVPTRIEERWVTNEDGSGHWERRK